MRPSCVPDIVVDEDNYESLAIGAFIRGEITIGDLQASLELKRAQVYRLVKRFRADGPEGLKSGKIGMRNRAHSDADRRRIIEIVRDRYADFGPTFAAEKLEKDHQIQIAAETLRGWMKSEGIWTDRAGRKPRIYSPRPPRERRGELVQVDGSYHRWFEKRGPEACLLVFIDDATSELMLLRLVDHETSYNYMICLRTYIERYGCPLALFSDRHSIFRSPHPQAKDGERAATQFGRACGKLGIKVICAKTPQAKGRVERANRTLQDRLIKEMRLRNISTIESANPYLESYRIEHNRKFARSPIDPLDAHVPAPNVDISYLLTYCVQRKVFRDLSISFNKIRIILEDNQHSRKAIGKRVTVAVHLDGQLEVCFDETALPYRTFDKIRRVDNSSPDIVDHKRLGAALELARAICEVEPHHFKRNRHMAAGFRKHFQEPNDPASWDLRNAPEEIRRGYGGRSRAPLSPHPIVILKDRLVGS